MPIRFPIPFHLNHPHSFRVIIKEVGKGTGLGLSVSYFTITKNHSGNFEVQSEIDKGTTFIIELPLKPKQKNDSKK